LSVRDGPDGVPGSDDDHPFQNPGEFFAATGLANPQMQQAMQGLVSVKSAFFSVKSVGEVGGVKRSITAVLRKQNNTAVPVCWSEVPGGL
jgi:hypothetical protein